MYGPEYVRTFYNAHALREWERLEATAWERLKALIHADFLTQYCKSGDYVLDAGCGPGRFTIELLNLGAKPVAFDISDEQLRLAKAKVSESGLPGKVQYIQGGICDLSRFEDATFDATVCYGGALSYIGDERTTAIAELVRVTKPGGFLMLGVMSLLGAQLILTNRSSAPDMAILQDPERGGPVSMTELLKTGNLQGFPSRVGMQHPFMHLYTSAELCALFQGTCEIVTVAGSYVTSHEGVSRFEELAEDPERWKTIVRLERTLNTEPGLVDSGSHIILVVRRI